MSGGLSELELVNRTHVRDWLDGKYIRRPESHFLDLVVDGVPLREAVPLAADMVTELNRPWLPFVAESVDVLLGRRPHGELAPGRVSLLMCQVCGDLGCGALTARLDVGVDEVRWTDWKWEDWDEPRSVEGGPGELRFDRSQYEAVFLDAPSRVAGFPYDQLAHRGKRILWPWEWGWRMPRN